MGNTLQFHCPKCERALKVRDEARGKIVRCPGCESRLRVPAAKSKTPTSNSTRTATVSSSPEPASKPKVGRTQLMQQASDSGSPPLQQTRQRAPSKQAASKQARTKPASASPPTTAQPNRPQATSQIPQGNSLDDFDLGDVDFGNLDLGNAPTKSSKPVATSEADSDFFGIDVPAMQTAPIAAVPKPNRLRHGEVSKSSDAKKGASGNLHPKQLLLQEIRKQLSGNIPKHRVGLGYRIGISVTAWFMLMLPLVYVSLILCSIYGMYYYATEIMPSLMSSLPRGRIVVVALAIYITPLIVGCAVILFMIKPVFLAVVYSPDPRSRFLSREHEPLLFDLVDHICEVTGSPKPTRISVDTEVNASASFGQGLRSLFSNDLVLTIGVPLVAGLNTREFAGVLAHEFGHFSQGAGMRANYLIRSINGWFSRVVYQRDEIDEALQDAISDSESGFGLILMVASFFVFVTRCVMWAFMMVAHLGSCFLLRQMEFDADRYETHVSGSQSFASGSQKLRMLGYAQMRCNLGLLLLIRKAVMIDDIPRLIHNVKNQMPAKDREEILDAAEKEKTSFFDTHPCEKERVAAAAGMECEGIWKVELPARELFRHYDALCRNVTQDFYRNRLGRMVDPAEMEPVEKHIQAVLSI